MTGESLRVCFVSLMFSPAIGGAEKRVEKQARRLRDMGHESMVVTARIRKDLPARETIGGLPVFRVGGVFRRNGTLRLGRLGAWPLLLGTGWQLWRLRRQMDVIHVAQMSPLAAASAAFSLATGIPLVISLQTVGPSDEQRARIETGRAQIAQGDPGADSPRVAPADWVTRSKDGMEIIATGGRFLSWVVRQARPTYQVLSTASEERLIRRGIAPEQIVRIPGSVDTGRFCPTPRSGVAIPAALCVARLEYAKGIDILLRAWAQVARDPAQRLALGNPLLRLVGDGELQLELRRLARVLGIEDSVEFLGAQDNVLDWLGQASVFVLPSRWEGMPNALLEAMACGLPCVATHVSGSEDLITDGINGLLVPPEDPSKLADAIRQFLGDGSLADGLGRAAREKVVAEYDLSQIAERCVTLYRRLIASERRPASRVSRSAQGQS